MYQETNTATPTDWFALAQNITSTYKENQREQKLFDNYFSHYLFMDYNKGENNVS